MTTLVSRWYSSSSGQRLTRARPRAERGTGGVEVLAIGFLVFMSGTLLVASAWGVVDTKMAAISASREGARAAAESSGDASSAATRAATTAWTSFGRREESLQVDLEGDTGRCGRLVVVVTSHVQPIRMPWLGSWGDVTVVARHSEIVDPYRSGLEGEATCD
jgi:Flp pilus assembly protein TadG